MKIVFPTLALFKKLLAFICTLIMMCGPLSGQSSVLVYENDEGKLKYEPYANRGEDTLVNIIPDFSHAGYMGGGVPLPENIPVKIILEPSGAADDRARIQDAIDQVAAMPPDDHGHRGVILLKKGLYKVNGSLEISTGGIVLRGEGQLPASSGGTELLATARTQHSFIKVNGIISGALDIGTQLASFAYPADNTWIVEDVTEGVSHEFNHDSVITFVFYSIESGNYKFHSKENGISGRIPYLEVKYQSSVTGLDVTIKILPSDDTYVRGVDAYRNTIYGNDNQVYYKKIDQEARIGFIKFPLYSIGGTIKSAEIHVMSSREDQSGTNYIAYTSDDDWSEDTRTWNNTFSQADNPVKIITPYVGTGSRSFVVEDASGFAPGDKIFVRRTPNQYWCDALEMSTLSQSDPEDTDWTPASYTIDHPRRITAIHGDTLHIDIPVVDPMQDLYGGGKVLKDPSVYQVQQVGIENMYISSEYQSDTDEDHGWNAININNVKDSWVRNVSARYFGYSCVYLHNGTSWCTVQDCAMLDPKSITTGSRKYPFPVKGGIGNLVQRCYSRGGRHSFVTHARVTGPHVFLDCYAVENYSDIGPHHRWAAGILFDNVYGGQIRVQNRWNSGTGHGWAGVQNMFWNCHSYASTFKVESPLGGMNWGIGCTAQVKEGDGYWEHYGQPVLPRSLYLAQLKDRLGQDAVDSITTTGQQQGRIWHELAAWAGLSTGIGPMPEHDAASLMPYPNPAGRELYLDLSRLAGEQVKIVLIDLYGKIQYNRIIPGGTLNRIDLPESIRNQLILVLISGEGIYATKKIRVH